MIMTINMIGFLRKQAKEFLKKILVLQMQELPLQNCKEKMIK